MADPKNTLAGSQPPPQKPTVTYTNPRRTSHEKSITMRHHRMAREASKRNASAVAPPYRGLPASPRRNSSEESNETGVSDPQKWFDRSNENPKPVYESPMELDPPFFQKETDSSNEEGGGAVPSHSPAYRIVMQNRHQGVQRPELTRKTSSTGDFRSVIDDLTIENKRLREELKRYRQMGPDSLRGEKLFEVKVHGLPSFKKRELEAKLRDFTASLDGSSPGTSPRKQSSKLTEKDSKSKSAMSKHASSSSGSNARPGGGGPPDSAYASMSIGNHSAPSRPSKLSSHNSKQAIDRYLKDVPEGWTQTHVLTEKDKKKLVVKRLEQLFIGKGLNNAELSLVAPAPPATSEDVEMVTLDEKVPPQSGQFIREAQIILRSRSGEGDALDNGSASQSNGEQTDSRDAGIGIGNGNGSIVAKDANQSDPDAQPPEQRPTRIRDLDPDRVQVPAENMDYIRHLGLDAPETQNFSAMDVSPNAEGWIYLNLLGNLAQLHTLSVTPAFIRSAVSEKSKQFQLSLDGRKIRWRGGVEGSRFTSDSSGGNSQGDHMSEDTDGSHDVDRRKKLKTNSGDDVVISEPSKFGLQVSTSSDNFHYKPLFVHHQSSSDEPDSMEDGTGSLFGAREENNLGMNSRRTHSGVSGLTQRKRKREAQGAIIYYNGAPFCTDLSGDFGDGYANLALEKEHTSATALSNMKAPRFERTASGSSIPFKPLSSLISHHQMMDLDFAPPELSRDDSQESEDMDADFPWSSSSSAQPPEQPTTLEASGLAGVTPDDHFVMHVQTKRPKSLDHNKAARAVVPQFISCDSQETATSRDTAESLVGWLATMRTTDSPVPTQSSGRSLSKIGIEYVGGQLRKLDPVPLPSAGYFYGSTEEEDSDSDSEVVDSEEEEEDELASYMVDQDGRPMSRRKFLRPGRTVSGSEAEELSGCDEEGMDFDDDGAEADESSSSPESVGDLGIAIAPIACVPDLTLSKRTTVSSVATAWGASRQSNAS